MGNIVTESRINQMIQDALKERLPKYVDKRYFTDVPPADDQVPRWEGQSAESQKFKWEPDGFRAHNGSFMEPFTFTVTSDGSTITGTIDKNPTGDLTELFSDGQTTFSSGGTVTLTAGGAATPQKNFVYVLQSAKGVLAADANAWPATEHIKVAEVIVQTAALVQSDGLLANRFWNDFLQGADNQGHHLHVWERLRFEHSAYFSGSAVTWTGSGGGTLDVAITAGKAYQLHLQDTDAFDTTDPDNVYVVNQHANNGGAYDTTADIETLVNDSADGSLAGRYYNLVIWASVSSGSETEKMFINLPGGSYLLQGDATDDVSGFDVFDIPSAFRGFAFLVQRTTIKHSAAGGGTWTIVQEKDLRGTVPNIVAGGGTAAITTQFADSQFRIFDDGDPSKFIAFQASGISASTTRTITMPDEDVTLGGDITTDDAWVAEGDLIKGTGANAAEIFSKGADHTVLTSTATTLVYSAAPPLAGIADTGDTTQITLSTASPEVTMENDLRVSGMVGIMVDPLSNVAINVTYSQTGGALRGLDINPSFTTTGNSDDGTAIKGSMSLTADAARTGLQAFGLDYAASASYNGNYSPTFVNTMGMRVRAIVTSAAPGGGTLTATNVYGIRTGVECRTVINGTVTMAQGYGIFVAAPIESALSGGTPTITNYTGIRIEDDTVSGTNGYGLHIDNSATYAIFVDTGLSRFDGDGTDVFELPADATANGAAQVGRVPVSIGGGTQYFYYYGS